MKKRLYRSEKNKQIAGVCGGIAEYFNIDATPIRIIWALVGCFWGVGILAYIICALVIPTESEVNKSSSNTVNAESKENDNSSTSNSSSDNSTINVESEEKDNDSSK